MNQEPSAVDGDIAGVGQTGEAATSPRPGPLRIILRRPLVRLALGVLLFVIAVVVLSPWLIGDPNAIVGLDRLQGPSGRHWFGTDNFGRDVFARVFAGGRASMFIGLMTALVAVSLGVAIALVCSFFRAADLIIMRIVDGIMAFPVIILALSMLAIIGPGVSTIVLCLSVVMFPGVTRIVRSTALVVAELPMVDSARVLGANNWRILTKYILPSCMTPIVIQGGIVFTVAILIESGLSFIGAGLPPDVPSWGDSLATSRNYLDTAWWLWVFPGAMLITVVLAVNTVIDALRDAFDPREAGR